MKYAGIKFNDIVDGEGVCVSYWTQGCPYHCFNCHNPHTWDFNGGLEVPDNIIDQIINGLNANGIQRNFSILGGEPLCNENIEFVDNIISKVRQAYPTIKIYIWTGNTYENLISENNEYINSILNNIDILVDGPYMDKLRNLNLKFRGSSNQRVIDVQSTLKNNKIILYTED